MCMGLKWSVVGSRLVYQAERSIHGLLRIGVECRLLPVSMACEADSWGFK